MVGLLLKAGAKVNVKDVRGMTPLMLAVATDHPSAEVVRMLMDSGADIKAMTKEGETVFDWELKFRNPQIMAALGMNQNASGRNAGMNVNVKQGAPNAQAALGRSLDILGRTAAGFFKEGGCGACHAQNLTGMAAGLAAQHGVPVPPAVFEESNKGTKLGWSSFEQPLMQRMDPPGGPSMISYTLLQLAAGRATADRTTDAMVFNLAASQKADGRWAFLAIARAPMQDADFGTTALALRSLQLYGAPGRKAEFADRVGRAAAWLASAKAESTEDRVMQVLGLKWAGGYDGKVAKFAAELASLQREDGGWAQTPYLNSDAYATGQTLYSLYEAGMPASDPIFKRGIAYLVKTQAEDGTWHVAARATKVQPYFQSGFPYAHDQWISNAATSWAAMALSLAEVEKPAMASVR
jgi:hypothetical protein